MSKAALNSFGFMLAEELGPRGIAVLVLNPGVMDTDMHLTVLAARRGNPDTDRRVLEPESEALLGVLARALGGALLGDVAYGDEHARDPPADFAVRHDVRGDVPSGRGRERLDHAALARQRLTCGGLQQLQ
jgi:NAD(P)-dependent dehydrogenase (short-subunit alcohol dehydrogenase family)